MPDVTVVCDDLKMKEKLTVAREVRNDGVHFVAGEKFVYMNDGAYVEELGHGEVRIDMLWDDVPQNIRDAQVTIHNFLTSKAKEEKGLI